LVTVHLTRIVVVAGLLLIAGGAAAAFSGSPETSPAPVGQEPGIQADDSEASAVEQNAEAAFDKNYRYSGGEKGRKAVEAAIDAATEDMNALIRGIARKKLRDVNRIIPTLGFSLDGDPLRASYIDGHLAESPASGKTVDWVNQFGDTVNLSQRVTGNKLVQVISDSNGSRRNVYRFSEDGSRLTMYVTIEASRLPTPVKYQLSYRLAD
jgi:hypothetical protein